MGDCRLLCCCICSFAVFFSMQQSSSAQISVQQPVVESIGVATTVTVPDRGAVHLGSLGIARDARIFFGPGNGLFPRGSTLSQERSHSGLSLHATIQDLSEMDRALLDKPAGAPPLPFEKVLHGAGPVSYQHGIEKAPRPSAPVSNFSGSIADRKAYKASPLLQAGRTAQRVSQRYLQQGIQAEKRGNRSLAKIYYRLAVRNGSEEAANLLKRLER